MTMRWDQGPQLSVQAGNLNRYFERLIKSDTPPEHRTPEHIRATMEKMDFTGKFQISWTDDKNETVTETVEGKENVIGCVLRALSAAGKRAGEVGDLENSTFSVEQAN